MTLGRHLPSPPTTDAALSVTVRSCSGDYAELSASGEIDYGSHRALLDALAEEIGRGRVRIVLELSGVTFCDSTGLGVFVRVRRRATEAGGWLRLAAVTTPVRRALQITNLDRLIPAYDTVDDAAREP
ncbi:MAG TPA: STAS domain-containing protein [Pilimelia sp.]|nr:STAS domain-containing protein [Pilimelia sp.]